MKREEITASVISGSGHRNYPDSPAFLVFWVPRGGELQMEGDGYDIPEHRAFRVWGVFFDEAESKREYERALAFADGNAGLSKGGFGWCRIDRVNRGPDDIEVLDIEAGLS